VNKEQEYAENVLLLLGLYRRNAAKLDVLKLSNSPDPATDRRIEWRVQVWLEPTQIRVKAWNRGKSWKTQPHERIGPYTKLLSAIAYIEKHSKEK
jgi:hypothetical protein